MHSLLRGALLFLGVFLLLNALGELLSPYFDQSAWIADVRFLPPILRFTFLVALAVLLIALSLRKTLLLRARYVCAALAAGVVLVALAQSVQFYRVWYAGNFVPGIPVPLTLAVALGFALLAVELYRDRWTIDTIRKLPFAAGFLCAALALPLAQMAFFGKSDYRRKADAIVVYGARAYADGRLSDALADRMRTGVALYQQGLAPKLILSGGPGDGAIHEAEAMRDFARDLGVPLHAMELDRDGLNTGCTARNMAALCRERNYIRVLAVSHFYHLPRVKMSLQRHGVNAYIVPAKEAYTLRKMPCLIAREVAALWVYYFSPIAS